MKTFILTLFFLCFTLSSIAICTQTVFDETQSNPSICNQELFEKAEHSYNLRKFGSEAKAERELKEVVLNCANSFWSYQAEEYLKIMQEEQAAHNFVIAQYYWEKFQNGKTKNLNGVLSRLNIIIKNYPNYSQMDKVRHLLSEVKEKHFQ